MKARIKTTREIVEVENLYDDGTALVKDRYIKVSELDFFEDFETIDWEQRRYEIAKSAIQGLIHSPIIDATELARISVAVADALIEELKKGG